jgi:DNA topoisomerase-3
VIRVSRKPVSKGRQFYTCGSGGGEHGDSCGFFEWIDDTEPTGNNFERHNNNRNNTNNHAAPSRNNGARNCECGQPAKELTVTKNNDNHGRKFVKCAKPQQEDPCNFFEWLD